MMEAIGSQKRSTLAEENCKLITKNLDGTAVVRNEDGILELWARNDDYAGFVLEIDGVGYEFVRSMS